MQRKSRRRSRSKPKRRLNIIGIVVIVAGVGVGLYMFDAFPTADSFKFSIFTDWHQSMIIWPLLLVLIGFYFVIRDIARTSSNSKWDSDK
jgi:uncharacterized membrane protein YozB (DUF420 family)